MALLFEEQARSLTAELIAQCDPGVPVFVLIDPMVGEPLPVALAASESPSYVSHVERARADAWQRPIHRIALSAPIDLPEHLHPYLVALRGPHDPWLPLTCELALTAHDQAGAEGLAATGTAPHRIGAWLHSTKDGNELCDQLAALMRVNTEANTQARYQRLADPRVMTWLGYVVDRSRLASSLGRISRWTYLNACGHLAFIESGSDDPAALRLSRTEWQQFMQGERLHSVVARWLGEQALTDAAMAAKGRAGVTHRSAQPDAAEAYGRAQAALRGAELASRRWPRRFVTAADHEAWAVLSLLHGQVLQHPDVASAISATPDTTEPVQTLQALCHELHAQCLTLTSKVTTT